MPAGRPSSYDPSYCEQVVEWGQSGKSATWMAAQLGVHRDTLYEWAKVHDDFSDAFMRARHLAQAWWEDQGQSGLFIPGFNGSVWAKNMGARFKDEWGESSKIDHTSSDGTMSPRGKSLDDFYKDVPAKPESA